MPPVRNDLVVLLYPFLRKERVMKLIEYRGEVLSGYVPDLPKSTVGCGEMLCPFNL